MLNFNDQMLLEQKGISEEKINLQLSHFKNGFPFMDIVRPATINDGIISLNNNKINQSIESYNKAIKDGIKVTKFVPASGAATRMFKALYDALDQIKSGNFSNINKETQTFFQQLNAFAFAKELSKVVGIDFTKPIDIVKDGKLILETLLLADGLNYGNRPKGVLLFHKLDDQSITPLEEHLHEGSLYAKDADNNVHIHFTVSPEHENLFKKIVSEKKDWFEKHYNADYKISFSKQKPGTDTLAVTPTNEPFRQENGSLLFRPAGHGALIENLNDLHSDIVFIKNIDNVVPLSWIDDTVTYKKALAGTLIEARKYVFEALHQLSHPTNSVNALAIIAELENQYNIAIPLSIKTLQGQQQCDVLFQFLNRPLRVCGMVRNSGEPGGGPFWVNDSVGNQSMQIIESSQIDLKDSKYKAIFDQSTHFNPVDLVCCIRNYKGQKFNLDVYVDADTGFISEKSMNGKPLKALELPGLWNGAMAHWLTIFVEVPLSTFNPVKIVNDLLRSEHQPK